MITRVLHKSKTILTSTGGAYDKNACRYRLFGWYWYGIGTYVTKIIFYCGYNLFQWELCWDVRGVKHNYVFSFFYEVKVHKLLERKIIELKMYIYYDIRQCVVVIKHTGVLYDTHVPNNKSTIRGFAKSDVMTKKKPQYPLAIITFCLTTVLSVHNEPIQNLAHN